MNLVSASVRVTHVMDLFLPNMKRSDMVTSWLCHMLQLMVLSCFYVLGVQTQYGILVPASVIRVVLKYGSVLFHLNLYCQSALASPGMFSLCVTIKVHRPRSKVH
jgi:hypothetical protein